MKHFSITGILTAMLCVCTFMSCGNDNGGESESESENGGSESVLSNIIGSQWQRSYYWIDDNDGSWEKGECLLTFTSADQAEEYITYNGRNWEWSYEKGDHYETQSGTRTHFYTYRIEGSNIILTEEDNPTITARLEGNSLIGEGDYSWTLVKAGTGSTETPVGGNPETGIASFVIAPVRSFEISKEYNRGNIKAVYDYSGNKVVRIRVSGSTSGSYSLSYTNEKVTMTSMDETVDFNLNENGYTNSWYKAERNRFYYNEYDSNGYLTRIMLDDNGSLYEYRITVNNGNITYIEKLEAGFRKVIDTFTFKYSDKENKNGLYPESCILNIDNEILSYLGILGKPSRNLVSQIDFTMYGTSNGCMVFSYYYDNDGNVTSYQYTDDPFYKETQRRQTSPRFKFEY